MVCVLACLAFNTAAPAADFRETLTDAQEQFDAGRFDQALKLYESADKLEPGHAAVTYNQGLCRLSLGEADGAVRHFESVASRGDEVNRTIRGDAFYNIGMIRAESAHRRLADLLAPATQPSDRKPPPDDPANIERLQSIAEELLRAIDGFRQSNEIDPGADAEHNLRTARIMRRDVLGLLRKAAQARQKEDMLKDPRGYLESLIFEQRRQAALGRLWIMQPPQEMAPARAARRAGLRAQRKIMENTATFADHLSQYREPVADAPADPAASAPASRPAEGTPREQVYHAAARQIMKAVESQKEACAFLLDGEMGPARDHQVSARDLLDQALFLFPLDPAQVLVKAQAEQTHLRGLIEQARSGSDWLREPLLPEAAIPKEAEEPADRTPIHEVQTRTGAALAALLRQCQYVASTSQPAEDAPPAQAQPPPDPTADPELNRKLAAVLEGVAPVQAACLGAIAQRDRRAASAHQEKILELIKTALDLLPKTLEQKIQELISRQHQLLVEVRTEAGGADALAANPAAEALDEIRQWATRFKSQLLGRKPGKRAEGMSVTQKAIQADTGTVNDEVREQIPAGADAAAGAGRPPASQPAELKALIEASKHLSEAGKHMEAALKGFEQAVVADSLKPMEPEGPVQVGQSEAIEELFKALMSLRPPASQPSDDQNENQQQQQQQRQQQDQDTQRDVERIDRERERAERELFQRRPREVIKDW